MKSFFFHTVLLILLGLFASGAAFAEKEVNTDKNTLVEVRKVSEEKSGQYTENEEYIYDRLPPAPQTWWDSFKQWFWDNINDLFGKKYAGDVLDIILYLLIIAAIIFIIFKVLKADMNTVFRKNEKEAPSFRYTVTDEDIHEIDFEALINEALEKKNYREAVRLYYLKILKALADRKTIHWKMDKTNEDYYNEIADHNLKSGFGKVSRIYEYIWYGDFKLKEDEFRKALSEFKSFNKKVAA